MGEIGAGREDKTSAASPLMSPGERGEILLEKTIRIRESYGSEAPEDLQKQGKIFTTEAKGFKIRRGHTIIIRRCQNVMKHLWQTGHTKMATQEDVDQAIFYNVGGDYRTSKRYRGFYLVRAQRFFPGYLQRLRYIEKVGERRGQPLYHLNHYLVPLAYHYQEELIPPETPLLTPGERVSSKVKMCVESSSSLEQLEGPSGQLSNTTNNNTNTHTKHLSESIPDHLEEQPELTVEEHRILNTSKRRGPR